MLGDDCASHATTSSPRTDVQRAREPVGALSIASISSRIAGKRVDRLLQILFEQKASLERLVRNAGF